MRFIVNFCKKLKNGPISIELVVSKSRNVNSVDIILTTERNFGWVKDIKKIMDFWKIERGTKN